MARALLIGLMAALFAVGLLFGILLNRTSNDTAKEGGALTGFSGMAVRPPPVPAPADDMSSHHSGATDMSSHHGQAPPPDPALQRFDFANAVGQTAPDFALPSSLGGTTTLSQFKGKHVLLFFNEGAMCYPSCWKQMELLNDDERLNNDHATVLSVVVDPKSKWDQILASQKQLRSATILFDTDKRVSAMYGALYAASSMHKGEYPGHSYLLIDEEGVIRYGLDDPDMGLNNEALAEALADLGA